MCFLCSNQKERNRECVCFFFSGRVRARCIFFFLSEMPKPFFASLLMRDMAVDRSFTSLAHFPLFSFLQFEVVELLSLSVLLFHHRVINTEYACIFIFVFILFPLFRSPFLLDSFLVAALFFFPSILLYNTYILPLLIGIRNEKYTKLSVIQVRRKPKTAIAYILFFFFYNANIRHLCK